MKWNCWFPLTLSLALVLAGACQNQKPSLPPQPQEPARAEKLPPAPPAWTQSFQKPCLIVANRIEIVGPEGLREHLALRAEGDQHVQQAQTTAEGFRQSISRANAGVEAEIRAYIDRWQLVALDEIRVLERPVPCDVRILAIGDVLFVDESTKQERRAPQLEFTGPIRR
jgi:hypothetical protein